MNNNGKHGPDLTPEERIAFLESLLEDSAPWTDNGLIFIQFLDDNDPQVRALAIRGLWYYPEPALIDRLIEMAEQDPSPLVRARAVSGLGIYMYEGEMADYGYDFGPMTEILREEELPQADFVRAKEFLQSVYADVTRSLDERRFALEALSFLSDPEITDLVEEAYNQPEREMKISAVFAMGRSGLIQWTDILGRELHNDDWEIQREAIRAVGEMGLDELGKDLWRLTYADEREIMLEALAALAQTGWEGAFDRIDELTLDSDQEIALAAEEAMDEWILMNEIQSLGDEPELDLDWDEENQE
jgi:HEAT repeat protein